MNKTYFELSGYQSPEIVNNGNEINIKRGFQTFNLNHLGDNAKDFISILSQQWEYKVAINWINDQPIIVKSKMIGVINTLFANRIICITYVKDNNHSISIESLERDSKLIGKIKEINPNSKNVYMYSEEQISYTESFSNKTFLRENNSRSLTLEFLDQLELAKSRDSERNLLKTGSLIDIVKIFKMNEKIQSEYESEHSVKYWNFHDKVFDRKTRSWNDNIIRSGSYRFLPDKAPSIDAIEGNSPLEYHKESNLLNPLSKRIGKESLKISSFELGELCSRAFMDIKVDNMQTDNEKYQKKRYRPYPSAGGIYELEVYILAKHPGEEIYSLYKYESDNNVLTMIELNNETAGKIADYVKRCWATETEPRYILLMIGNYTKLSYKYENIAYRLMLINTGCAVSSFYQASKSMSIGCCCTGCGPSDLIRGIIPNGQDSTPLVEIGFGKANE